MNCLVVLNVPRSFSSPNASELAIGSNRDICLISGSEFHSDLINWSMLFFLAIMDSHDDKQDCLLLRKDGNNLFLPPLQREQRRFLLVGSVRSLLSQSHNGFASPTQGI